MKKYLAVFSRPDQTCYTIEFDSVIDFAKHLQAKLHNTDHKLIHFLQIPIFLDKKVKS
jgi:hypothetical protein